MPALRLLPLLAAVACHASPPPAPSAAAPRPPYDPCAGKRCGDPCRLCPPGDADCIETMVLKACDASGRCAAGEAPSCAP